MRYGVFGGTFDPIHMGHLRTAEEMVQQLNLTKLFLIPAATPPHKNRIPVSAFRHRFEMAKMAVGNSHKLEVLDIEARRKGPSYSVDTLRELRSFLGGENDLYFIVGLEGFFEIHTWKEYRLLFDLAHFVVVDRMGYRYQDIFPYLAKLGIDYRLTNNANRMILASGNCFLHMAPTRMDISSTQIRRLVRQGLSIRYLVPDEVMNYILAKRLYTKDEGN